MNSVQQMDGCARQNQVALSRLLGKRLGDGSRGAQTLRQGIRHVRQRKPRPARYDEGAFAEQCLGLIPLGNVVEGIDPDQEKDLITLLQSAFQSPNRLDGVIRLTRHALARRWGSRWRLQQRWYKRLLSTGCQSNHRVTMNVVGQRLALFVRWKVRGNKVNTRQRKALECGARQGKMSAM